RREVARVEVRDGAGPALPPHHALPEGGDGEADGRDGAEAGDDDAGAGDGHGGRAGAGEGKSRGPEGKGERKSGREGAVPPFTRSPSPPVRRGVREGSGAPLRLDVVDGVADGGDLLGVLVRDRHVELLLELHDELDGV